MPESVIGARGGSPRARKAAVRGAPACRGSSQHRTAPGALRHSDQPGRLDELRAGAERQAPGQPGPVQRRLHRSRARHAPGGTAVRPVRGPADPADRGAAQRLRPGAAAPARRVVRGRGQGRLPAVPERARAGHVDGDLRRGGGRPDHHRQAPPVLPAVRLRPDGRRTGPAGRTHLLHQRQLRRQALDSAPRPALLRTRRVRQARHHHLLRRLPDDQPGRARADRPQGLGDEPAARAQRRAGRGDLGDQPAGADLRT